MINNLYMPKTHKTISFDRKVADDVERKQYYRS
jgi:hypothetical protein